MGVRASRPSPLRSVRRELSRSRSRGAPLASPGHAQRSGREHDALPAEAEDPSCGPDSDITGDQLAGTSLRKALVGCTSEGYCGGDATPTQCSLCVTDALVEGEASLETSYTLRRPHRALHQRVPGQLPGGRERGRLLPE